MSSNFVYKRQRISKLCTLVKDPSFQPTYNGSNIFGTMHGNSFETWVVRGREGLIMASVREANSDNLGKSFRFSTQ